MGRHGSTDGVYKGEGHQLANAELAVKHVRQAIEFFRAAPPVK